MANGNGYDGPLTDHAREWAMPSVLILSVVAIGAMGVSAFFTYPLWDAGVLASFTVLSNVVSYCLGTKSALATPRVTPATTVVGSPATVSVEAVK